jgi:hypothetical protein
MNHQEIATDDQECIMQGERSMGQHEDVDWVVQCNAQRSMIWFLQMAQLSTTMSKEVPRLNSIGEYHVPVRTPCPQRHCVPLPIRHVRQALAHMLRVVK